MNNELMRQTKGEEQVPARDRRLVKTAKLAVDDVRLASLKADGAMALAGHMMDGLIELDARAQSLAAGDPIKMAIIVEIEATAIRQCKEIQRGLFQSWNL